MSMISTQTIDLRRTRDFGQTINVVFEFLRENWRPLGRSLLYLMTPILIVAVIAGGAYLRSIIAAMPSEDGFGAENILDMYAEMLPTLLLSTGVLLVGMIFMFCIVCGYVRLYLDRAPEPITVEDVWREVRESFVRVAFTMIVSTIVAMPPMLVLLVPAMLTGSVWMAALAILVGTIPTAYLMITMAIIIPMRLEEEIGVFEAIGRCLRLTKGRWWFTFWILFIMQVILMFASILFQIPMQIVVGVSGFADFSASLWLLVATAALNVIGTYLLYSILALTCSVLYYNLVEQKEGVGMMERISEIGAPVEQ